jgi:RNA polymerase sigma factor (TIGR02999 family)
VRVDAAASDITGLLERWSRGDAEAGERLYGAVYDELRRLARAHLSRERDGHTLSTKDLVHEVYLRLAGGPALSLENRRHFFGVASRSMRQVLINYAKSRSRQKRGDGNIRTPLDAALLISDEKAEELVQLDEALDRLQSFNNRQSQVVELRYFGGFSLEETAEALGLSPATVKRDWTLARAWLHRELAQA